MKPRLQKIHPLIPDQIHYPVFLGQAAGPDAGGKVFEGFGFADAREWIAHHGFDQFQNAQGDTAVGLHPVPQVFPELRLEYGQTVLIPQGPPRPGAGQGLNLHPGP